MVRSVTEDTEFETEEGRKYSLRKGDKVAMYPPAIHKDPEIFENPDVSVILTLLVIKIHLQKKSWFMQMRMVGTWVMHI